MIAQKIAIQRRSKRPLLAPVSIPTGNRPARRDQHHRRRLGTHRLAGVQPRGYRLVGDSPRGWVLQGFQIIEHQRQLVAGLLHQCPHYQPRLVSLRLATQQRAIHLFRQRFLQAKQQLVDEIAPSALPPRRVGPYQPIPVFQALRQTSRQTGLALTARAGEQTLPRLVAIHDLSQFPQFPPSPDKRGGQRHPGDFVITLQRRLRRDRLKLPVDQRLRRVAAVQQRQAPLAPTPLRRAGQVLAQPGQRRRLGDKSPCGLQGDIQPFLSAQRLTQGMGKVDARHVQNGFPHPHHMRQTRVQQARRQAGTEIGGRGFARLAGRQHYCLHGRSRKRFCQFLAFHPITAAIRALEQEPGPDRTQQRVSVELAMTAQEHQMKFLLSKQLPKMIEAPVVGRGQLHQALMNQRIQRLQHVRLLAFHIQAFLLLIQIVGQGGEQQDFQWAFERFGGGGRRGGQAARQAEAGVFAQKAVFGMMQTFPRQGLHQRIGAFENQRQYPRAGGLTPGSERFVRTQRSPQRIAHSL